MPMKRINNMITSKLEVLVDFGPKPDENLVQRTLSTLRAEDGVKEAVFLNGAIMVETTLPNQLVLDVVAKTSGKRAVLQGFGESESAVAMVSSHDGSSVRGVIRFQQVGRDTLVADGSIDCLPPGPHGLHVRDDGDISQGCHSLGPHYNPTGATHGAPGGARHAGDLGNIVADEQGRASFRIIDNVLKISDIIGRAIAVTEREDDFGMGSTAASKTDGDSGPPIACGVIARSAGIFQNPKRICLCDGVLVWDERDRPLAGRGRRAPCCPGEGARAGCGGDKGTGAGCGGDKGTGAGCGGDKGIEAGCGGDKGTGAGWGGDKVTGVGDKPSCIV